MLIYKEAINNIVNIPATQVKIQLDEEEDGCFIHDNGKDSTYRNHFQEMG